MLNKSTITSDLPTAGIVVDSLNAQFSQESLDLRDITCIARQDPVVLANIMFMVNQIYLQRGYPVVNTLSAAINLVGVETLKDKLSSIKIIDDHDTSYGNYQLIRSRIYVAASMTQFWAEYMGQTCPEEMFCASMLTGFDDLAYCLNEQGTPGFTHIDINNIEQLQGIYSHYTEIGLLPDSIQNLINHGSLSQRLKLSLLVYELIACLEYGYSTCELQHALKVLCEFVGIGIHRAGYDMARHIVKFERSAKYHAYHHSGFLLTTNMQSLSPATH